MGSPGVTSGLDVQVPVDVPVTVTGLSANLVAALNPTFGTITANH
ncbi:chaplin family protein [Streptomyces gottesmaniae]